jgi:acetyl esterase/lipase
MNKRLSTRALTAGAVFAAALFLSQCASAPIQAPEREGPQPTSVRVAPDGTAQIDHGVIPPSSILSADARAVLARPTEGPGAPPPPQTDDMNELRRIMNERLQPNVERMRAAYPVDIEEAMIDGISVAIITPRGGVPERNARRVLINAPGGGFRTGIRANGLMVSIPVASLGQFKVVSILYRQGPEHQFPAATDDFLRVYRALQQDYPAQNIGFFGCSAGGALVSQTVAALIRNNEPTPGAIGVYCAGLGARFDGDSASFAGLTLPTSAAPTPSTPPAGNAMNAYFAGMDINRPDITPANDPAILARFPPTIFLTATRDFAMSQAAVGHRRLLEAGVQSDLLIYDGLGHGFMTNALLPETREGQTLTTRFYDRHLGR